MKKYLLNIKLKQNLLNLVLVWCLYLIIFINTQSCARPNSKNKIKSKNMEGDPHFTPKSSFLGEQQACEPVKLQGDQQFCGWNFWGCWNRTECVRYGKARTPFGERDILFIQRNITFRKQRGSHFSENGKIAFCIEYMCFFAKWNDRLRFGELYVFTSILYFPLKLSKQIQLFFKRRHFNYS